MHRPFTMGIFQSLGDANCDLENRGKNVLAEEPAQRLATGVFHHQISQPPLLVGIKKGNDIEALQASKFLGLLQKTLRRFLT